MRNYDKDLILLVADGDAQLAVDELLKRHQSLGIRKIQYDMIRHPQKDSGCRGKPEDLLRVFCHSHRHAIVLYDHHGSGRENKQVDEVEAETRQLLSKNGWGDRAEAVVLAPELEIWMWSDSPEVDRILGWQSRQPSLRDWIFQQGLTDRVGSKPGDPKAAYHRAVREVRIAVSAAHFRELAKTVSFRRCTDPSFDHFKSILQKWFPSSPEADSHTI